jgi:TatD DNase family protein
MFIDSHCHINFPELMIKMEDVLAGMKEKKISHALCVSVTLDKFPEILELAKKYEHIFASVGVHPDYENISEPTPSQLVELAKDKKSGSNWGDRS